MSERPILYLDVDDTILMFPPTRTKEWWEKNKGGAPAPGVREFLEWARPTCEVRWLTCWAMGGHMGEEAEARLARILKVPLALIAGCDNPIPWGGSPLGKPGGIDWTAHEAGREWAWVEDGLPPEEMQVLKGRCVEERYYYTNTSVHPEALAQTLRRLKERWGRTNP